MLETPRPDDAVSPRKPPQQPVPHAIPSPSHSPLPQPLCQGLCMAPSFHLRRCRRVHQLRCFLVPSPPPLPFATPSPRVCTPLLFPS